MAKPSPISAIDYVSHTKRHSAVGVCAVFGDDTYLKREIVEVLRDETLAADGSEFSFNRFAGRDVEFRDVLDALATQSLFGGQRRLVVIEEADTFVTAHRDALEDYVARPHRDGLLVLEVKTWPANTRLAKAVAASSLAIDCRSFKPAEIRRWLTHRAQAQHGVQLESAALDALLDLLPAELGILSQEVAKLSLMAGEQGVVDEQLVLANVGGWRTRSAWEMVDAAADGRAAVAMEQLGRLLAAGEKPHGLLPQISHSLRQLAAATTLIESSEAAGKRLPLPSALKQAGVPPFKLAAAERQLRQLGRERAKQLTGWLLAADLAIKGHNSSDARARLELERLFAKMADSRKLEVSRQKAEL